MLAELKEKIKDFWNQNEKDIYIALVIFLVGMASFGLGRLSVIWSEKEPITIEQTGKTGESSNAEAIGNSNSKSGLGAAAVLSGGKYVASKNGGSYHFPWCPGAQRIKESNKIWFNSKEEAESRGYKPASNCEGL